MVSSGPGPPSVKSVVTTLACKKLPVAIINQPTAKMVSIEAIANIYTLHIYIYIFDICILYMFILYFTACDIKF